MMFCMKCGGSYFRAAMTVAIIDVIYTAIILILFVLGTSLMVGFEFQGGMNGNKNVTRLLDELTDDVFGTRDVQMDTRQTKDIAEDMGVFLIIMFLSTVDFIVSCIFLDGVKTKNVYKCQAWFNIRLIVLVIFDIVVFINVMYGSSWYRCIPDAVLTVYRLVGIMIGYAYLQELQAASLDLPSCQRCHCRPGSYSSTSSQRASIINLSARRKDIQEAIKNMPNITVTGPEDTITFASTTPRKSLGNASPQVAITRKSSAGSESQKGKDQDNALSPIKDTA